MRAMMAKRIIAARKAVGLSQAALARSARIRVETLNRLEKGKHTADLATMAKINKALDDAGAPVPKTLVEVWQANAAGRYAHRSDQWPAPLDPNFLGIGRCLTNDAGVYRFLTVRPGAKTCFFMYSPTALLPA